MQLRSATSRYHGYLSATPARILLAEDDVEMRRLLAATLRRDGYEVIEAADGIELRRLVELHLLDNREHPAVDLVITDIRMPGQSGLRVLAGLRSEDWATPVLLITAFGDEATHAEAKRMGAAAVFDKPFDLDDLRTAVLNLVGPSRLA